MKRDKKRTLWECEAENFTTNNRGKLFVHNSSVVSLSWAGSDKDKYNDNNNDNDKENTKTKTKTNTKKSLKLELSNHLLLASAGLELPSRESV